MLSMLTNTIVLGQIVVNGLNLSSVYILVALGFTLLFGIMRVVNFAHGEFAMLGGFAFYYLYAVSARALAAGDRARFRFWSRSLR